MPRMINRPLPDYGTIVRWTVQDVINWLSENDFSGATKCFREAGVDGNKFVHITKTDLVKISCPKRCIDSITEQVEAVSGRPGAHMKRGGITAFNQVPVSSNNFGAIDDEDGGWGSDEFTDDEDEFDQPNPVAPPRPNRRGNQSGRALPQIPTPGAPAPAPPRNVPPVQEDIYDEANNEEPPARGPPSRPALPTPEPELLDYDEPNVNLKRQNFHGGPLPPLPTAGAPALPPGRPIKNSPVSSPRSNTTHSSNSKPPPIGQRKPPPLPTEEDEYCDPDATPNKPLPPPIANMPKRMSIDTTAHVSEHDDPYVPSLRPPPPPSLSGIPKQPSADADEPEEDYEEPIPDTPAPPPVRRNVPLPAIPQEEVYEQPENEVEEFYVDPDTDSTPPPVQPPSRGRRNDPLPKPPTVNEYYVQPNDQGPQDTYEACDGEPTPPGPPIRTQAPPPPVDEEVYEQPENDEGSDANYLQVEHELHLPPARPAPRMPVEVPKSKKNGIGGRAPPLLPQDTILPTRSRKAPPPDPIEPQETYVVPDTVDAPPPPQTSLKKKTKVSVLPPVTNVKLNPVKAPVEKLPPKQPPNSSRALPPPPTMHEAPAPPKPAHTHREAANGHMDDVEGHISGQKWYHGDIERHEADKRLMEEAMDGMYLIRKSTKKAEQPYTLQIYCRGTTFNLPVWKRNNLYNVGSNKTTFATLTEMINSFKTNTLVLNQTTSTKLVRSLPKT